MLKDLSLFEVIPREQRASEQIHWWQYVRRSASVPYPFGRGIRIAADLLMLCAGVTIGFTTHLQGSQFVIMEVLFLGMFLGLFFIRRVSSLFLAVGLSLLVIALSIPLNDAFAGMWGSAGLYSLCVLVLYCFPWRWSLPLATLCLLTLLVTDGFVPFLPLPYQHMTDLDSLVFSPFLALVLCWFGWSLRSQYMLIVRLHQVQTQLREHMAQSEGLAATRERTRIARDIHDVLSHSLAVLSIQVQALRHIASRNPDQLETKLDEMASLLRESIAESRRVVGLLRERPTVSSELAELGSTIRALTSTFNERTGIDCRVEESGHSRQLHAIQTDTLILALRELLTNAHRHGAARTIWISVRWREASLLLTVRDDGHGAAPQDSFARSLGQEIDGHHGLEGIRERMEALDGDVKAGPLEPHGFLVTLCLPFELPSHYCRTEERSA